MLYNDKLCAQVAVSVASALRQFTYIKRREESSSTNNNATGEQSDSGFLMTRIPYIEPELLLAELKQSADVLIQELLSASAAPCFKVTEFTNAFCVGWGEIAPQA
jgi:hypothetical protein